MLIQKGGITRNISEDRLHEYTAKGYAPVDAPKTPEALPAPKTDKQPKKPDVKE